MGMGSNGESNEEHRRGTAVQHPTWRRNAQDGRAIQSGDGIDYVADDSVPQKAFQRPNRTRFRKLAVTAETPVTRLKY